MTVSYLGSILGPAIIGFTADAVGLRAALGIVAGLGALIVVSAQAVSHAAGGSRAMSSSGGS